MIEKTYIKDLEFENNLLLVILLISIFVFTIFSAIWVGKSTDLRVKNARLEQQVKDYTWQLEQVQYIMEYQKGE